jgi:transposase-like protein
MKGVKQVKESTGRMKKHRYSTEFKVTAVKMANAPDIEVHAVAQALGIHPFWHIRCRGGRGSPYHSLDVEPTTPA